MSPSNVSNVRLTVSLLTRWIATKWTWSLHCRSEFVWQQTRNVTVLTMMNRRRSANAKRFEFNETNSDEIANPTVIRIKRSHVGAIRSVKWSGMCDLVASCWSQCLNAIDLSIGMVRTRKVRTCMYNSVRVQLSTRQFGSEGIEWSRISELNT